MVFQKGLRTASTLMLVAGIVNLAGFVLELLFTDSSVAGRPGGWDIAVSLAVCIIQLACGLMGLLSKADKKKLRVCFVLGVAVLLASVAAGVLLYLRRPEFEVYYILGTAIWPLMYLANVHINLKPPGQYDYSKATHSKYTGDPAFINCERDRKGRPVLRSMVPIRFLYWFCAAAFGGIGLFALVYPTITLNFEHLQNNAVIALVLVAIGGVFARRAMMRWWMEDGYLFHTAMLGTKAYAFETLRQAAEKDPPVMWSRTKGLRFFTDGGSVVVVTYYSAGGDAFVRALSKIADIPLPGIYYSYSPKELRMKMY